MKSPQYLATLTVLVSFAALATLPSCVALPGRASEAQSDPGTRTSPSASIPSPARSPSPKPPASQKAEEAAPDSAFYKANIGSLKTFSLDNGVPVHIKRNPANRILALKLVLRGTSVLTEPGKAGIEALTLQTMARGSARYSYDALAAMAYYRSSAIASVGTSYDYSTFDLVTFDKYFDETFDAFADCFVAPTLLEKDFETALAAMKASRARAMSDPYGYATSLLHDSAFKGHPYAADPAGTDESLASMTIADARAHYRDLVVADRLSIVAVGDFDEAELVAKLNAAFGKLPRTGLSVPETIRHEAKRDLILAPFPSSPGVAYVRGDYAAPKPGDPDWTAYSLSSTILSELLFSIVRNKYAACYTPFSNAHGFRNSYGSIGIYKTSKPAQVKTYIDEAIAVLTSGRGPNLRKAPGVEFADLEDTIEAYKAKYVNAFYAGQQTNIGIAGQIADSISVYGRADEYLKAIDRLEAVKAGDVARAARKYIAEGKIRWIVVADQADLDSVKREDWLRFTGKAP